MSTTTFEPAPYQSFIAPALQELPAERQALYHTLAAAIGYTPLRAVTRLDGGRFYSKEEWRNPSGNHYDRAYLPTLAALESQTIIRAGDELRDITSGSAGTSLAQLGTELGYPTRITVPSELPENRLAAMRSHGATLVDAGRGYINKASAYQQAEMFGMARDPAWKRVRNIHKDLNSYVFEHQGNGQRVCYINHSENLLTPKSFATIGHELIRQITEPPVAAILAIGNWTTIAGISPVLRAAWPDARIIGYESPPSDTFEGYGYGTANHGSAGTDVPIRFRDEALLDEIRTVSDGERDAMHARVNNGLPRSEQMGRSSLMGLVVARAVAEELRTSQPIVTIAYDTMDRY